ncbi:unnamed protein product [Urochloa humidicola]
MASSSSPSNPLAGAQVTEKLTKQNHAMWVAQVLAALRGARLEGHISGRTSASHTEIEQKGPGDKMVRTPNLAFEEWEAWDQQILSLLLTSLLRDVVAQVVAVRTVAQAWRAISNMFASQMRARAINVRLALATTKKGTMNVSDYFGKMRSLGNELAVVGKPIEEDELVAFILNGLDVDFNPVVSALMTRVDPISLEAVEGAPWRHAIGYDLRREEEG